MLDREALDILRDKTTSSIARQNFRLPGHEKRKILTGIDQLEGKRRAGDLEASWLPAEDAEARTAYSAILELVIRALVLTVEKVGADPVGDPRKPENNAETRQKRRIRSHSRK